MICLLVSKHNASPRFTTVIGYWELELCGTTLCYVKAEATKGSKVATLEILIGQIGQ